MKRTVLVATIAGILLLVGVSPAFANHIQDVLGEQTSPNEIVVPPVVAGAGSILPDSPFYVVDKAFQNLKLSLSFSPEKKAEARNLIIGERLAELRVMAERNNTAAVHETLQDIAVQSERMAADLADAAAQGRNVSAVAQNINNTLRVNRGVLNTASQDANGPLALQLKSASQSLLAAKVQVEEHMPDQQMVEAMQDDLEDEVDTQVLGVETATNNLEDRLTQLDKITERAEKSGINPAYLSEIKQKRQELQAQIKSNSQSTKEAVNKLKQTRKDAKSVLKNIKPTVTCIEANFKNHGQYVSCVAKQKQQGLNVRDAAQSNRGQNTKRPSGVVIPSPSGTQQ